MKCLYDVMNRVQFVFHISRPVPGNIRNLMFHELYLTYLGWGGGMRRPVSEAEERLESFQLRRIDRCEVFVTGAIQLFHRFRFCLAEAESRVTAFKRLTCRCGNHR